MSLLPEQGVPARLRFVKDCILTVDLGVSSHTHSPIMYQRVFHEGERVDGKIVAEDGSSVDLLLDGFELIPIYQGQRAILRHVEREFFQIT